MAEREILFRGKGNRKYNSGGWYHGYLSKDCDGDYVITEIGFSRTVIPSTVGQYTGLTDKNGKRIFEGDIVKIVDFQIGKIVFECGAMGIDVLPRIDWNYLDSEIACITGHDNRPYFCCNDNFISLWELMWNYNQEENACDVVEVIGNVHDNRLEDFYGR